MIGVFGADDLDRDLASKARLCGTIDRAEAACTELLAELVPIERLLMGSSLSLPARRRRSERRFGRCRQPVNRQFGARRLQTVMERVLDEISFAAPDRSGETVKIDAAYVREHIGDLAKNADLSRFIL